MASAAVQSRFAPDAVFRYVGGDLSLDLVNTADWTERGLERDRLTDYSRLLEWARGAGVLGAAEERRIRQVAQEHPRRAAAAFSAALRARDVLQRVFSAVARDRVTGAPLDALNNLLAEVAPHLRIVRASGGRLARGWAAFGESLDSIARVVVWAAVDLLASSEAAQLRVCGGIDCGWMYLDRSRNGLRRWCEMSVCGTTEKNRRRARPT